MPILTCDAIEGVRIGPGRREARQPSEDREYGVGGNPPVTRLTSAFPKKLENHAAAVVPYYMHYNCCRIHQTLRVTPAMEAAISSHMWSLVEIVGLLDAADKKAA